MTQRENLLHLLRGEAHEFIPVEFMLCPSLIETYKEKTGSGLSYQDYFELPWRRLPDLKPDHDDRSRFDPYHKVIDDATEIDEWGIGHRSTPTSMHMTQMLCPLKDAQDEDEIANYPLPTYSNANNANLKAAADELHARGIASCGNMQCTIWETSWYIRGMENLMMDMMSDDPMAEILLDKVTQMSLSRALLYANAGADILFLGDDIGMQNSIMMSADLYKTWIQPRLKYLICEVKKVRPDIIVFYHSCGFIEPLIPLLIDAGIDVLNPVQPECMSFKKIYDKFNNQISLHGVIGTQTTMPRGTPEDVREAVFGALDIAKQGKLLVAPTHLLEPDVPFENIIAYVQACRDYANK